MRRATAFNTFATLTFACSFTPPTTADGVDAAPNVQVDAHVPSVDGAVNETDAAVGLDAPPQITCTTSDGSLKLCLEFEDTGLAVAVDGSGLHHDATMAAASATTRDVPVNSRAIGVAGTTAILIPDTNDFDSQTVTISAWVQRSALPSNGQRFGVVDVGRRQAALAIDDQGRVTCFVKTSANIWFIPGGSTTLNQWALAACTYDAPTLCAYSFRNGSSTPSVVCGNTDGATLDTSTASGSAIGALLDTQNNPSSRLAGNVDSVRVYSRALSESELCNANALSGC